MNETAHGPPAKKAAAESGVTRTELGNGVVIALAGLLISFATYEGELWNGEEDLNFSRANVVYTQAARTWGRANAVQAVDVLLFSQWANAAAHNDTILAAVYAAHLPPDAQPAFKAWLALDPLHNPAAPASPMAMPQYAPAGPIKAASLEREGDAAFDEGRRAKRISESYGQAGAILSTSLFFAGISQIFDMRRIRFGLLTLATLACAVGVLRLVTLPLLSLYGNTG